MEPNKFNTQTILNQVGRARSYLVAIQPDQLIGDRSQQVKCCFFLIAIQPAPLISDQSQQAIFGLERQIFGLDALTSFIKDMTSYKISAVEILKFDEFIHQLKEMMFKDIELVKSSPHKFKFVSCIQNLIGSFIENNAMAMNDASFVDEELHNENDHLLHSTASKKRD